MSEVYYPRDIFIPSLKINLGDLHELNTNSIIYTWKGKNMIIFLIIFIFMTAVQIGKTTSDQGNVEPVKSILKVPY